MGEGEKGEEKRKKGRWCVNRGERGEREGDSDEPRVVAM